jgi:hypothetical protein
VSVSISNNSICRNRNYFIEDKPAQVERFLKRKETHGPIILFEKPAIVKDRLEVPYDLTH